MSWSRYEWIALTLFVLVAVCSLIFLVHPWYDYAYGDSGLYIYTARGICAGEGYSHLGIPFHIRPPGFSAMIAPVICTLGTNFQALNSLIGLFGIAGSALLFVFARERLGWILALVLAAALWLNPEYQRLCNQVMADVPGVALILLCLVLGDCADRAPSWRRELVLGLCIALTSYVRPAAILLVPAIVVSRLWRRRGSGEQAVAWFPFAAQRLVLFSTVVCIAFLPWIVRNRLHAPSTPADQTSVYSYAAGLWHSDPGDPTSPVLGVTQILRRIPENAGQIAGLVSHRMLWDQSGPLDLAIAGLVAAALIIVLVRRRAPAELFALGVLLLLMIYYDFRSRLLWPVYVVGVTAALEVARDLGRRVAGFRIATVVIAAAVLTVALHDFCPRCGWRGIEQRHHDLFTECSTIESLLAPDARIATPHDWRYEVCLERPVFSLSFAVRRAGRVAAAEAIIDKYGINTVVLSRSKPTDRMYLRYFMQHFESRHELGGIVVLRVRP
jgi:hypothetical protein